MSYPDGSYYACAEYRAYHNMKQRCLNENNPRFHRYGGRGITICPEWLESFENFFRDMGKKPDIHSTIQRIDNDGPYAKWNCKWATWDEQLENKPARGPAREMTMKLSHKEATCFECGEAFPLNRPDRQFCSGRCRSKNFRRVQSEKLNTLEKLFAQYVPKQDDAPQAQTHPQTHHDLFA